MQNEQVSSAGPRVAVIILTWNNFTDSRECINSVLASDYPDLLPILIDNGSRDGSFEKLIAEFPTIVASQNAENLGFSRGCNVGIRIAMSDLACDYFMLLNNDCILSKYGIKSAMQEMQTSESIGIVTGKVLFNDGTNRIWHAGGSINTLSGSAHSRGMREVDIGQFDQACDTGWASGAMMLIRRSVLTNVGLLPEEYFFGLEEWDYSIATLQAGYRIRYAPHFVGHHHGDGSHNNHDPKFVYNYFRNKLIFQERHHNRYFFFVWKYVLAVYVKFLLGHKIKNIKKQGIFTDAQNIHRTDDIVSAAIAALRDHGKNTITEETLLDFERAQIAIKRTCLPGS